MEMSLHKQVLTVSREEALTYLHHENEMMILIRQRTSQMEVEKFAFQRMLDLS